MAITGSQTKYPQSFNQPYPASNRRHWINTANLKTKSTSLDSNYAQCNKLSGVNGSYPFAETLQLLDFRFNIPEGAEITSIKVVYSHRLAAHVSGKYPKVAGPNVMLKNATGVGDSNVTGVTPVAEWRTRTITYSSDNYPMPSVKTVNGSNFGVEFRYPKNTSNDEGYIFLNNVSVTIYYKVPVFNVDLVASSDTGEYVKDTPFHLEAVLNNPDLSGYIPTLQITVPTGTTLTIDGISSHSLVKLDDTTYQWKPAYSTSPGETITQTMQVYNTITGKMETKTITSRASQGAVKLGLLCTIPSVGNKTLTITELYGNHTKSISVTVIGQATPIIDDVEIPSEQVVYAIEDTDFTFPVQVSPSMLDRTFYLVPEKAIKIKTGESYNSINADGVYQIPSRIFNEEGYGELTAKTSYVGVFNMYISDNVLENDPDNPSLIVKVVPEGFDVPRLVVMKLTTEEANRLGDKFNYTVQADMRITCLSGSIPAFVDYYRNFRIGVVNSINDTLNVANIFNACKNWSTGLSLFNDFENKNVNFTYNKDYPVYILITGNYEGEYCDLFECEFANVEMIESSRDDGDQVIFPVPIQDIISEDAESISDLSLPANSIGNNLIFYELPLKDTFVRKSNLAIRGIAVRVKATTDYSNILSAKLKSPTGLSGERSILLNPTSDTHVVGGDNDRWGFRISELAEIDAFELELNVSNNNDIPLSVAIEKVEFIVYYTYYDSQLVDWIVEDENMASFNVFLQDVKIPIGLKTNTKYLSVDGTDTNNAYRQNIRENTIEVEFDIDECNIEESTKTLDDVAELLHTERDNIYRPIPKKLEFSHYPDRYWNYIMEEPIEAEADGAGYKCKAKLVVPAGTAYTKEEINTGKSGRVAGLAKVNPIILIKPTSQHIEITDTFTDQTFVMTYSDWTTNDIVEIDCQNRRVLLHSNDETTDITVLAADWNTDWFLISNQFLFEESGCVIQSVTWVERK